MSGSAYLLEQAQRCRRLANGINDPRTVKTLRQMAGDFERQAAELAKDKPPVPE